MYIYIYSGHMTKMATTPIYGKNPSKIVFSDTDIKNPGHMTKMAAIPIYGKNPSKIRWIYFNER